MGLSLRSLPHSTRSSSLLQNPSLSLPRLWLQSMQVHAHSFARATDMVSVSESVSLSRPWAWAQSLCLCLWLPVQPMGIWVCVCLCASQQTRHAVQPGGWSSGSCAASQVQSIPAHDVQLPQGIFPTPPIQLYRHKQRHALPSPKLTEPAVQPGSQEGGAEAAARGPWGTHAGLPLPQAAGQPAPQPLCHPAGCRPAAAPPPVACWFPEEWGGLRIAPRASPAHGTAC